MTRPGDLTTCGAPLYGLEDNPPWLRVMRWLLPGLRTAVVTLAGGIYLPDEGGLDWSTEQHECLHYRDWAHLGRFRFVLAYMGWPLPVFLAYTRWRLERGAYALQVQLGDLTPEQAADLASGWLYWRMWPRAWCLRYFGRVLAGVDILG